MAMSSLPWILVCPASRGIGLALARRLVATTALPVLATTRHPDPAATKAAILDGLDPAAPAAARLHVVRCDVTDEPSIAAAAAAAARLFPPASHHLHLACALPGVLRPEKSPAQIEAAPALHALQVNALGPLLLAKHFFPLLPRRASPPPAADARLAAHATWLTVAARLGSTSDNRAGGWFSYRASKAAAVSATKSLDVWLRARAGGRALAVAYHPGTVRTDLTAAFWASVPRAQLQSPEAAAERLVAVVRALGEAQRGRCWDWRGDEVLP